MTQTSISTRAWAELLLLGLLWGGSFLAIRTALDEIGPLTSVLFRTGLAALMLWPIALLQGHRPQPNWTYWGPLFMMGLLNNVIPFTLMAWGQLHIPSGLTSILNATTAIFGVLIAAMVFADERLSLRKLLGVGLGFTGVILVIGLEAMRNFDISSIAQLAVIAGTFSYACAGSWARKTLTGIPPIMAATGMLTMSSLCMVPLALIFEGAPTLAMAPLTWLGIIYYAGFATALAYLLYYRVLAMAGSGNLLLVTLIIPPVAICLGAWVRGEVLPADAYLGFFCLALGLVVLDGRLFRGAIRV